MGARPIMSWANKIQKYPSPGIVIIVQKLVQTLEIRSKMINNTCHASLFLAQRLGEFIASYE